MVARLERLAPLAGALAGVLWLVGILVLQSGNPADPDSPDEIVGYFRDDSTTILAGGLLVGLGVFAFFWFLAVVPRSLLAGTGDGECEPATSTSCPQRASSSSRRARTAATPPEYPRLASPVAASPFARFQVAPGDFPFLAQIRGHDDERLADYASAVMAAASWPE